MDTNILFGTVVAVNDDEKLYRIKVKIQGYTDKLEIDDLAWYYPFFGIDHIPLVDEEVACIIVNDDFTNGFYTKKINLPASEYSDSEYENYLEIYKRLGVQLTYNEADGIRFINQKTSVQVEDGRSSMYVEDNQITLDNKRIDLGTNGEATPLGDKTVKLLKEMIKEDEDGYNDLMMMMKAIKTACESVAMLKPIAIALTPLIPISEAIMKPKFSTNTNTADTIQSKKTFIE